MSFLPDVLHQQEIEFSVSHYDFIQFQTILAVQLYFLILTLGRLFWCLAEPNKKRVMFRFTQQYCCLMTSSLSRRVRQSFMERYSDVKLWLEQLFCFFNILASRNTFTTLLKQKVVNLSQKSLNHKFLLVLFGNSYNYKYYSMSCVLTWTKCRI